MKSKKSLFIITFLFLGVLAFFSLIAGNWEKRTVTRFSDLAAARRSAVKIPPAFPKDMPFIDANLLEMYTRDAKTGDITAIIHSAQSVKNAFNYYINYGKRNGWRIMEAREQKESEPAKLLLQKNTIILSLAIEREEKNSKITVSSTSIPRQQKSLDIKSLRLK